jgi:O-acetyl-ADP-ribose deacetylase (regulator of RNase III)
MTERTTDYKINATTFRVTYGDITQLVADAVVSSDDNYLSMGGGVSYALLTAGGESIRVEARKHIPLKIGDVVVTSAGNLPAKYIFHAVTIDYTKMISASEDSIRSATLKSMQLADTLGVKTIAFPALGTGVASFPFQLAAEIMTRTITEYLIGKTGIEFVTITLMDREGVRAQDINLFYERVVGLASISLQSKHLRNLLDELAKIVDQMNQPSLANRVAELQVELSDACKILEDSPKNLEDLEEIQTKSEIVTVAKHTATVSSEIQGMADWEDKQLEAEVLRARLGGLYAQLNVQYSNLNRYEIEKAKYGGQLVPPRLENAIEDINKEISETEGRIQVAKKQLPKVTVNLN